MLELTDLEGLAMSDRGAWELLCPGCLACADQGSEGLLSEEVPVMRGPACLVQPGWKVTPVLESRGLG